MSSYNNGEKNIFIKTPLIYSKPCSDVISRDVYLKLENTQPSGSFKLRGLSHLCQQELKKGCTKFVGSSGGNAGVALAYTSKMLGIPSQIFVPEYVAPRMLDKIRSYGAEITIFGKDWKEADDLAHETVNKNPTFAYISPYDHPDIWDGHATMIQEIKDDLNGMKPSCFVVSVGGGGLLLGILKGLEATGWEDIPILAMETLGADCFNLSIRAKKRVEIELTSIAKTLGARQVALALMERYPSFNIVSEVLPDKEAVHGCIRLADDHGFMVEPSCGVTMASVYSKVLPSALETRGYSTSSGPVVLITCGGSDLSFETLQSYISTYGSPLPKYNNN